MEKQLIRCIILMDCDLASVGSECILALIKSNNILKINTTLKNTQACVVREMRTSWMQGSLDCN